MLHNWYLKLKNASFLPAICLKESVFGCFFFAGLCAKKRANGRRERVTVWLLEAERQKSLSVCVPIQLPPTIPPVERTGQSAQVQTPHRVVQKIRRVLEYYATILRPG